jgi:hypothetical protein
MDDRFVAACEAAFASGGESRIAAAATVQIKSLNGKSLNGKGAVLESALEAVWDMLCRKRGDMTALEVLAFVRERVPNIDQVRVREELRLRFQRQGVGW